MGLQTSRKVFESKISARLVGRTLGIVYWIINVTYLIKESLVVAECYFRYLLSQNASTAEQIQVVETVLKLLGSYSYSHFLCSRKDSVNVYSLWVREKLVDTPCLCKLSKQEMVKEMVEPSCPCWHCMAKAHVKESPPVKLVLQQIKVKTVSLNLKKDKKK